MSIMFERIKDWLNNEVNSYSDLSDEEDINSTDDAICFGRKEAAESLLENIERWGTE